MSISSAPTSSATRSSFLAIAKRPSIVKRSLIIAVIVGTVLNVINQGDVVMGSATFNLFKCLLTYVVPYCVATYGAVSALQAQQRQQSGD